MRVIGTSLWACWSLVRGRFVHCRNAACASEVSIVPPHVASSMSMWAKLAVCSAKLPINSTQEMLASTDVFQRRAIDADDALVQASEHSAIPS
eukprot:2544689-Amphidinium_carterae.1